jgi:hypothetical protein
MQAVFKRAFIVRLAWERLEMVERYSHAVPLSDRSALPNPFASATLVHYPRDAKAV